MPIYEYYHPATGECIEARQTVAKRDQPPMPGFVRRTAPSRVGCAAHLAPPNMRAGVLGGYYEREQKEGSRFRSAFTKAQIMSAWGNSSGGR